MNGKGVRDNLESVGEKSRLHRKSPKKANERRTVYDVACYQQLRPILLESVLRKPFARNVITFGTA
jgi:hypothetical protein